MGKTLSSGIVQQRLASLEKEWLAGIISMEEYRRRFAVIRETTSGCHPERATSQDQESVRSHQPENEREIT